MTNSDTFYDSFNGVVNMPVALLTDISVCVCVCIEVCESCGLEINRSEF